MTDPVLANAIARRDAARAEVERWESFIRDYKELSGPVHAGAVAVRGHARMRATATVIPGALSTTERAAAEIIRNEGRPLHTRELLAKLEEAGIQIGGDNPIATLSARLSRAESLENVRPYGWRIKETLANAEPEQGALASVITTQQDREAGPGGGT